MIKEYSVVFKNGDIIDVRAYTILRAIAVANRYMAGYGSEIVEVILK